MRSLYSCVSEAISLSTYKEFLKEFEGAIASTEVSKRKPEIDAYKKCFWELLKTVPGATVSRNGHRIYLPFDQSVKLSDNIEQIKQYEDDESKWPIELKIREFVKQNLKGDSKITNWNYRDGEFTVELQTQVGPKERVQKIGKIIAKNRELLDAYAADPIRLTSNIEKAKKLIVISDHAYDIAGMSTGRKWTSCMNIINGSNREYVAVDIAWGTLVAYLILEEDKNIEAPLGRVLIKPYELSRQGHRGFDKRPVVYSPDPTVYSPYVGLEGMQKYLDDLCQELQPYSGKLKQKQQIYYDNFFAKKDDKFNMKDTE